jgi:CelD/BcsL family acetyltransferase involved in cellulose biosynthesis
LILSGWDNDTLVAILPLYVLRSRTGGYQIHFLSSHPRLEYDLYPEHLGILTDTDYTGTAPIQLTVALFKLFSAKTPGLMLHRMNRDYIGIETLQECLSGNREESERTHVANLTNGFDNYLSRLTTSRRSRYRRLLRQAQRLNVKLSIPCEVHERKALLRSIIALHQKDWQERGQPGAFHSRKKMQFHEELLDLLINNPAPILAGLYQHGKLLYGIYGFQCKGAFEFYQSAFDRATQTNIKTPGILAHLLLMQELNARGVALYDFLSGDQRYKQELSTQTRELCTLIFHGSSLRGRFHSGLDYLRQVRHRFVSA